MMLKKMANMFANGSNRKVRGVDIIVFVDVDETGEAPEWVPAGGQRNATLSETSEALDATTKDSEPGSYEYEYGLYGWTISCEGLYVPDNKAYAHLGKAMRERRKVKVRIQEEGMPILEGLALVSSRELSAPYDDMTTYSMEFQGTGFLRPVEDDGNGGVEG